MARFEFKLPDIGEGVAEGEVVAWLVKPGDDVREDQEMVEVMTDKATVTIGAPKAGRIAQLNASVGERVKVGHVLVVIETSGEVVDPVRAARSAEADTVKSRFQSPARTAALFSCSKNSVRAASDSPRRTGARLTPSIGSTFFAGYVAPDQIGSAGPHWQHALSTVRALLSAAAAREKKIRQQADSA